MFKKALTSWAKEMDKQRFKEQEKKQKREFYIDTCVQHSELIQNVVNQCDDFTFGLYEQISNDTSRENKIEILEKGLNAIKQSIRVIRDNSKLYDLPPNAKQAYHDGMNALITAFENLEQAWNLNLIKEKAFQTIETFDIPQEEIEEILNDVSNLPDSSNFLDEYVYYRKLHVDKYQTALEIINSH